MSLRRVAPVALAAVALFTGCKNVKQEQPAKKIVIATFAAPNIPTPNDLVLQAVPTLPAGIQRDVLQSFVDAGGFRDQGSVSVPLKSLTYDAATNQYVPDATPPTIDPTSIVGGQTAAVFKVDGGTVTPVDVEAGTSKPGTIVIVKKADASGSTFAPGRYVFALRGGQHGVRTSEGLEVGPDSAIALTIPNKDLTIKENQPPGGLPAALIPQLETIRSLLWQPVDWAKTQATVGGATINVWAPCAAGSAGCETGTITPAYAAVDAAFPHAEVASIATFEIAPSTAVVPLTDTASGRIPFPSDFLLDPTRPVPGTTGRFYVRNVPSFGAAAPGLATLDGFSTTGMLLVPFTGGVPTAPGAVQASTINNGTVFLFELPAPGTSGTPRLLTDVAKALGAGNPNAAEILIQPPDLNRTVDVGGTQVPVATVAAFQPGVPVPTPTPAGIVYLPPLKEKKTYLVVVSNRVKDLAGNPIQRSTLGDILFTFASPLVDDQGHSQLSGVSDADAAALQALRTELAPILANIGPLTGTSLTANDVVMAYTVSTQTVTDVSVKLSAAPYDPNGDGNFADSALFTSAPGPTPLDLTSVGLPQTVAALLPDVDSFLEGSITTLDAIDPATGALNPDTSKWTPVQIPVLVAVPKCSTPPCVAPLVVWHHGINGGHLQMITVANELAKRGFVVAAIDTPYHGDRAFCSANNQCTTDGTADGTCTPDPARAGQGDAVAPGTCTNGSHLRLGSNLTTVASGNYFISGNFFRIRDGVRQDLFDQSALVLALARPPAAYGFPQPASGINEALAAKGIGIDPSRVYFSGLSLGGMIGGDILATNPRFKRGVLTVPGATFVDIVTNAPAFGDEMNQLFLSLGIDRAQIPSDPAVASKYVQLLILAKWILDPAETLNYAANVDSKLPSPLAALPVITDTHTTTFGQLSKCDPVVPNATTIVNGRPLAFGDLLLHEAGIAGTLYVNSTTADGCVPHGVIADTFSGSSIGGKVRDQAAEFLLNPFTPASTATLP